MTEIEKPSTGGEVPRYPKDMVHRCGAKAGLLLHVREHLSHIPQARMIVSDIGESTDDLLARADASDIRYPRLFRSSAVAELVGYEGDFPTIEIDDFETGHDVVNMESAKL